MIAAHHPKSSTCLIPGPKNSVYPSWGRSMFDTATTALLRAVLDEICESVSREEIGARTHVASKILEAATRGRSLSRGAQAGRP